MNCFFVFLNWFLLLYSAEKPWCCLLVALFYNFITQLLTNLWVDGSIMKIVGVWNANACCCGRCSSCSVPTLSMRRRHWTELGRNPFFAVCLWELGLLPFLISGDNIVDSAWIHRPQKEDRCIDMACWLVHRSQARKGTVHAGSLA